MLGATQHGFHMIAVPRSSSAQIVNSRLLVVTVISGWLLFESQIGGS